VSSLAADRRPGSSSPNRQRFTPDRPQIA
jgi:hypothetical protein